MHYNVCPVMFTHLSITISKVLLPLVSCHYGTVPNDIYCEPDLLNWDTLNNSLTINYVIWHISQLHCSFKCQAGYTIITGCWPLSIQQYTKDLERGSTFLPAQKSMWISTFQNYTNNAYIGEKLLTTLYIPSL